ncbi:MAG: tryptophan 2,3-dioxygenase family protein, partial [Flavobacteriales bacterium]
MYYSEYLQLDKILGAQDLESDKQGQHAHDEMLFIVIHQAYELWFKQITFEVQSVHN